MTPNESALPSSTADTSGIGGQPAGLTTLFFTEMWERFSYYGMRAILFLYMTTAVVNGGLGMEEKQAGPIYGLYASSVYFLPLIGGWIADRYIGARRATVLGGFIIMLGHFSLAVPQMTFFYLGLILVAVGTGFLKSNISAMVGDLYDKNDPRRDGGFSIFYMGINIGAFIAPLVCGYFAQAAGFRSLLEARGLDPNMGWHIGFGAAGVGMALGLVQYYFGRRRLANVGLPPSQNRRLAAENASVTPLSTAYLIQLVVILAIAVAVVFGASQMYDAQFALKKVLMPTVLVGGLAMVILTGMQDKLSTDDWKRIGVIFILFAFSTVFWMGFEQAATSLNAFADKLTNTTIFGYEFPASWLQSVNPLMIIALAPVFAAIWTALGKRQPSDAVKFSLGLVFLGLGFVVVAFAAYHLGANPENDSAARVTFLWMILVYLLHTIGELCLSPVGLSSMTKLAPGKMVSLMLGVWFLSVSMGNYFAGLIAAEFVADGEVLSGIFGKVAMVTIGSGILLFAISPLVNRLLGRSEVTEEI